MNDAKLAILRVHLRSPRLDAGAIPFGHPWTPASRSRSGSGRWAIQAKGLRWVSTGSQPDKAEGVGLLK